MSYIQPKNDYKDGDILYGIDLNASNDVIKAGVDDNFDRIKGLTETKQDVLTAGTGIEITEDNVINNTQTSAEWGNIQGDITEQTDLQTILENKVDKVEGKGLSTEDYTSAEKTKLSTIESGAEANVNADWNSSSGDSQILNKPTSIAGYGITDAYTKTEVNTALDNKVDKVQGKGLSSNDYTTIERNKLAYIEGGAEVNTIEIVKVDGTSLEPDGERAVDIDLSGKQETLVSGTNIKTINNQSILGSGNISVGGGSGGTSDYDELENRPQINSVLLTGNKSLSDLGINIPTKTSDLTNDSNFPSDASYVHTDNNYTTNEKTKLEYTNIAYCTCTTAAATAEKEITIVSNSKWELKSGSLIMVFFSNTNSADNPTFKVGNNAAKNIYFGANQITTSNKTYAGNANQLMTYIYDGTQFRYVSKHVDSNTTYKAVTTSANGLMIAADKSKLDGIESGAEVNVLESVKVNGTSQTITDKAVNIAVPTKLSDLTNDNNTVTDASYVHTDNNYTSAEKTKLAGIEAGAEVNVEEITVGSTPTSDTTLLIDEYDLDPSGETEITNEYSESTTLGYSCNYINNTDSYSTSEIKTNRKWINGKPIYRKTIVWESQAGFGSSSGKLDTSIAHNISNLGVVISCNAFMDNGGYLPVFGGSSTVDIYTGILEVNSASVVLRVIKNTFSSARTWYFTIEYTKTTD